MEVVVLSPTFQGSGLLSVAMSSSTIRPMTGDSVGAEGGHKVVLGLSTRHCVESQGGGCCDANQH